jgi:hypothetical protein
MIQILVLLGIVLFSLIWGIFRGIDEGIDMHQPSNKIHPWYNHYHKFVNGRDISAAITGVFIGIALMFSGIYPTNAVLLAGIIFNWEIFELAYSYTRNNVFIPTYENFLGIGWIVPDDFVLSVHVARIVAGLLFLTNMIYI